MRQHGALFTSCCHFEFKKQQSMSFFSSFLRIPVLCLFLVFFGKTLAAQTATLFFVDSLGTTVSETDENLLLVPIRVVNYEEVRGLLMKIQINSMEATLEGISVTDELSSADYFDNQPANANRLIFFIEDATPQSRISLADSTVLLELQLRFSGEAGTCVSIDIEEDLTLVSYESTPLAFEIADGVACSPQFAQITGRIESPMETAINLVRIELQSSDGEVVRFANTNPEGQYSFPELPYGKNYILTPLVKVDQQSPTAANRTSGINVADIAAIRNQLLERELFFSPYQFIAADLDINASANLFDIIELRDYILVRTNQFSGGKYWRFVDATYEFQNTSNALLEDFREAATVSNLTEDTIVNFIGIKLGDVNFSSY